MDICVIEDCDKPINKNDLCLRHKLLSVNIGTVPGGARDARNHISMERSTERGLQRYRDLKQAGEQPSGTSEEAQRRDSYKKTLWEKHEQSLTDENPPEKVTEIRKGLINK